MTTPAPVQTATIHPNEKCWVLREYERLSEDSKEWRRVQSLYLARDGEMREYRVDLGPASQFPLAAREFRIVSMGEDTVAEIREQADQMRYDSGIDDILRNRPPSTLIEDYLRFNEESWALMHNRSVNGPAFTKERNLFARKRTKYAQRN